jgi:hypothetical protein
MRNRVLSRLFLAFCTASTDKTEFERWYHDGWEWLEKFYDEQTAQQMASGTEPILAESRDAELLRSPIGQVHQPLLVTGSQLEASQDHNTGAVSRNSLGV